jgi:hypothetical protein
MTVQPRLEVVVCRLSCVSLAQYYVTVFISQNCELFTLTYGAIVSRLIRDYEDPKDVNTQLEQMYVNCVLTFAISRVCTMHAGDITLEFDW